MHIPLGEIEWTFDIVTDGQTLTIREASFSFDSTVVVNPLVTIDSTEDGDLSCN